MKHASLSLATLSILGTVCLAGSSAKSLTQTPAIQAIPSSAFASEELQFDTFGAYGVGKGNAHAGPFANHAWGGGIGVNYYWTENFGIGADGTFLYGRENAARGDAHHTLFQGTGSLLFRIPFQEYNIAPYAFLGGGVTGNAGTWASAHGGLGIDYRLIPHSVALFTDVRWTYYGDAYQHGDQNNFQARAGVRLIF